MNLYNLPNELILHILTYLSNRGLSRFLRSNRQHEQFISPVLYERLRHSSSVTYSDVLKWASRRHIMGTIEKVATVILPLPRCDDEETIAPGQFNGALHTLVGPFLYKLIVISRGHVNQHWAMEADISLLHLALDRGLDINSRDAHGRTPLMIACRQPANIDTRNLLKALLDRGAEPNAVDSEGWAALHHATGSLNDTGPEGRREFLDEHTYRYQTLLNYTPPSGIDLDVRNNDGRTPMDMLVEMRLDTIRPWYSSPASGSRGNRQRALIMLIHRGASVSGRLNFGPWVGGTVLHLACDNTDVGLVKTLLQHGATADINTTTSNSHKPLDVMVSSATMRSRSIFEKESLAIGEILLEKGAEADANAMIESDGYTPLMALVVVAAEGKITRVELLAISQVLLRAGADPRIKNAHGQTAWDLFFAKKKPRHYWFWEVYLEELEVEN